MSHSVEIPSTRGKSTEQVLSLIEGVVKTVSLLSLLIGSYIAWGNFTAERDQRYRDQQEANRIKDELEASRQLLEFKLSLSYTPASDDKAVLIALVDLENRGTSHIYPFSQDKAKSNHVESGVKGQGCTMSVTQHAIADVDRLDGEGERSIERFNLLERYTYTEDRPWWQVYVLKPKSSYSETGAFVLERGYVYEVVVRFYVEGESGSPWTISDTKFIHIQ
jgi:hypothetical protein